MNATTTEHIPSGELAAVLPRGVRGVLATSSAVDFWSKRTLAALVGLVVVVAGVLALVLGGADLDAELGGGDTYTVPAALTRDQVFDALDDAGIGSGAEVVLGRSIPSESATVVVRLGREHRADTAEVREALAAAAGVESEQVALDVAGRGWAESSAKRAALLGGIAAAVATLLVTFVLGWRAAVAALLAALTAGTLVGVVRAVFGVTVGERHLLAVAALGVVAFFVSILVTGQARANRARFGEAGLGSEDLYNVSANQALPGTVAAVGVPAVIVLAATIAALLGGFGTVVGLGLMTLVGLAGAWFAGTFVTVGVVALLGDNRRALDGVDHALRGETLRRVVAGGAATLTSVTGRKRVVERAAVAGQQTADVDRSTVRTVSPTATTEQILSHPARPRKKKRH